MEPVIEADILICVANGHVQQVVCTGEKKVAVIEVFEGSQIPLLTEMISGVMPQEQINATAQGAYALGQMKPEEEQDNGKEESTEETGSEEKAVGEAG